MPLIMQYFIVLKLLRLEVTEFLYYFTSCLSKKTQKSNKTQKKPHWVGLFKKTGVFLTLASVTKQ